MLLTDLKPIRHVLPNGIRLSAIAMPHVHRSVLEIQIRTGSRFESPAENGISHFLEHMLYRGTKTHPSAHEQALAFETLGGTLVAATAKDFGSMQIAMPPERFLTVLPLMSEVYREPLMTGIEIERGIVREEILETLDEAGNLVDPDDLLSELMFQDHPLGMPITGRPERVSEFDSPRLRAHHDKFYVGCNTSLVAAGCFDPERVLAELEQLFQRVSAGARPAVQPPSSQRAPAFRFVPHAASQTCLRVGFRAPSAFDPLEPATQLLIRLLDDGLSTRLYEQICDRRGLCYDVAACYERYEDAGLVELSAETANDRCLTVLSELFGVVNRLRDEGPTQAEMDKVKRRYGWQLDMMLDDPEDVATHFGMSELAGRLRHPEERRLELAAVSREGLLTAARHLFRPENLNVVAVGTPMKRHREKLRELTLSYA